VTADTLGRGSGRASFAVNCRARATVVSLIAVVGGAASFPFVAHADDEIAATVNGQRILVQEVQAGLTAALNRKPVGDDVRSRLEAEALRRLIDRKLVLQALVRLGIQVSDKEINSAGQKLKEQLEAQGTTLKDYLAERASSVPVLKQQLRWQLAWQQYLQREVTDQRVEAYFNAHRRQFDGTEVRASQVYLRPDLNDPADVQKAVDRLQMLRKEIEDGKLTFEEAAKRHSVAPSRTSGGDIGYFPRRGVMADRYAEVAFALEIGQISQPLTSSNGVHLIKVTEIKPGAKRLSSVREEVRAALAQELFVQLADGQRRTARITFSGKAAYYEPQTERLVAAER
jgi:peptidyl-prolyl cis-trans isomerase C